MVEPLKSCITPDRPAKYEPIKAGEYVEKRLSETYIKAPEQEAGKPVAVVG